MYLLDASKRLTFGPPRNAREGELFLAGATQIIVHASTGHLIGAYVDDQTPEREIVAAEMVSRIDALVAIGGLVIVGLSPAEPGHRIGGCICALEWYPYHDQYGGTPLPSGQQAYILQWRYAWDGDRPPTAIERYRLLARARLRRPKLILLY